MPLCKLSFLLVVSKRHKTAGTTHGRSVRKVSQLHLQNAYFVDIGGFICACLYCIQHRNISRGLSQHVHVMFLQGLRWKCNTIPTRRSICSSKKVILAVSGNSRSHLALSLYFSENAFLVFSTVESSRQNAFAFGLFRWSVDQLNFVYLIFEDI